MNLAVIFLAGIFLTGGALVTAARSVSILQDQTAQSPEQKSESHATPQASPPAPPQGQPPTQPSNSARKKHKQKVSVADCDSKPSQSPDKTANSQSASASAAANSASNNCPPKKKIVHQGGTSESGIQLAGGAGSDQPAQTKDTSSQLLGPTEENLKKIAGHQLTSDQQDMVNQVHQFMEQTKSAVAAGDVERARTLAWKAQVLSEQLAKPPE